MGIAPVAMRSWEQIETGLLSGDINAAFMDLAHAMFLYGKGMPISMLMFTHRSGSRVIASEKIQKMANFRGKSVLIPHRISVQHMLMHQLLAARQLDIAGTARTQDAVGIEAVPPALMSQIADADRDDDIAAFISPAPFGDNLVKKGRFKPLLLSRDLWKDHPGSVFVITRDILSKTDKAIPSLMTCFFKSARLLDKYLKGPAEANSDIDEGLGAFLRRKPGQIHHIISTSGISFCPDLLIPDPDLLNTILRYMSGIMAVMPDDTDFSQFTTPNFARTALSEL